MTANDQIHGIDIVLVDIDDVEALHAWSDAVTVVCHQPRRTEKQVGERRALYPKPAPVRPPARPTRRRDIPVHRHALSVPGGAEVDVNTVSSVTVLPTVEACLPARWLASSAVPCGRGCRSASSFPARRPFTAGAASASRPAPARGPWTPGSPASRAAWSDSCSSTVTHGPYGRSTRTSTPWSSATTESRAISLSDSGRATTCGKLTDVWTVKGFISKRHGRLSESARLWPWCVGRSPGGGRQGRAVRLTGDKGPSGHAAGLYVA